MDKVLQDECKQLIKKYNKAKTKKTKIKLRNILYEKIMVFQIKWIKTILKKWGKREEENEILSISWDTFIFCIEKYNNFDVHLPLYFYNFTRYFLLIKYAKKDRVFLSIDELKETLGIVDNPQNMGFEKLLTWYQFRNVIPDKYKIVWDDATQSLSDCRRERKRTKYCGIDNNLYCKLKEIYIPMIKLILK